MIFMVFLEISLPWKYCSRPTSTIYFESKAIIPDTRNNTSLQQFKVTFTIGVLQWLNIYDILNIKFQVIS